MELPKQTIFEYMKEFKAPAPEQKEKLEEEAVERTKILVNNKESIKEAAKADPNLDKEQVKELGKYLNKPEEVLETSRKALGSKQQSPEETDTSAASKFKQALTFFAPQLIAGAIGGAMEGERGVVAGFNAGGQLRDSYIEYQRNVAKDEFQQQQQQGLTPYQQRSLDLRQEEIDLQKEAEERRLKGLGLSKQKLGLDFDKFGFTKEKEGQLSGKQTEQLKDIISVEASIKRIDEIRENFNKTGPLAGRVQSLQQFADAAPKEFTQLKVQAASTLSNYVKSISGAQVTEAEAVRLEAVIPSVNDAPKVFEQKLREFEKIVQMNKKAFAEAIRTGQPLKAGAIKGLEEAESRFSKKAATAPTQAPNITEQDIDNMSMEELKANGLI